MQTPHIPNQISFAALQGLLNDAPNENDSHSDVPSVENMRAYEREICAQADSIIEFSSNIPDLDPLGHKVMILKLLVGFGNYLFSMAQQAGSEEEKTAYLVQVGKVESLHSSLCEIPMHNRDFTADPSLLGEDSVE